MYYYSRQARNSMYHPSNRKDEHGSIRNMAHSRAYRSRLGMVETNKLMNTVEQALEEGKFVLVHLHHTTDWDTGCHNYPYINYVEIVSDEFTHEMYQIVYNQDVGDDPFDFIMMDILHKDVDLLNRKHEEISKKEEERGKEEMNLDRWFDY